MFDNKPKTFFAIRATGRESAELMLFKSPRFKVDGYDYFVNYYMQNESLKGLIFII